MFECRPLPLPSPCSLEVGEIQKSSQTALINGFWKQGADKRRHRSPAERADEGSVLLFSIQAVFVNPSQVSSAQSFLVNLLPAALHLSIPANSLSTSNFIAQCPLDAPVSPYRYDKHTAALLTRRHNFLSSCGDIQPLVPELPSLLLLMSAALFLLINEIPVIFWVGRKWRESYSQSEE